MTISNTTLAPTLLRTLDEIEISPDGTSATVRDEKLEAKSPNELAGHLSSLLYQLMHMGREKLDVSRPRTLRDPELDRLLEAATPHATSPIQATLLDRVDETTFLAAIEGVRVVVPAANLASGAPDSLPVPATVRIPAARPALSSGFFLVDGSAGTHTATASHTLRVYVHVTNAEAGPQMWHTVLSALEGRRIRYRAKISSAISLYPRQDALVVYLGPDAWHAVPAIGESVAGLAGLGSTVSPFTHELAPGVSMAWEPQDHRPGMKRMSFGEHRSGALAEAVVKHAMRTDGVSLADAVAELFIDAGIDPLAPARNLDSPALAAVGLV